MGAVTTGRVVVIADGPESCFSVDSTMEGITKQIELLLKVEVECI